MTPEQKEVWDLQQSGMARKAIADQLGISESAVKHRLERARKWINADPAARQAATVAGSNALPHSFWVKTDNHSVYYKLPAETSGQDFLSDVADAFRNIPAIGCIDPPKTRASDLLAFYAIADVHLGLRAWKSETGGQDYDTDIAAKRLTEWIARLVDAAPCAESAIICAIGDTLHHNDDTNQTPQSRHSLDVDTRQFKTLDTAILMFASAIECVLRKHAMVTFCILPGNHDRDAYRAIMFAMRERYRLNDRVSIVAEPMDFFVHEFGKVMIACHHGDKAKANRLVLDAADRWPEMWGRTRHRFYFTGHLHSHKSEDIGGMQWEQLRAVTSKDSYASSNSWPCRPQMQVIVFDRNDGEFARFKMGL